MSEDYYLRQLCFDSYILINDILFIGKNRNLVDPLLNISSGVFYVYTLKSNS